MALFEFLQTKLPRLLGAVDYSGRGSANGLVSSKLTYCDSSKVTDGQGTRTIISPSVEDFYSGQMEEEQTLLRGALLLAHV